MILKKNPGLYSGKLGFSLLLILLNRFIITLASLETTGRRQLIELFDFKVFRQAFYASFARFDAGWYAQIAESGYLDEKTTAFFPLYPMMMKGVSFVTGLSYKVSGQLISILCFFLSLWLVQMLAEASEVLTFTGDRKRAGRFMACIIAFNPLSFFYTIPYTESLFLMLTLIFMLLVSKKKWLLAGIIGFFAGLTRNSGVLLSVIFLFEYLRSVLPVSEQKGFAAQLRHYLHSLSAFFRGFCIRYFIVYRAFFSIFLIPAGISLYFVFIFIKFGSFTGPIASQDMFGRSSLFPLLTIIYGFQYGVDKLGNIKALNINDQSYKIHYYILQFLSVLIFISAVIYLIKKIPFSYNLFMILSLLLPLSKPAYTGYIDYFVSFPRYTITLFPFFAAVCGALKGSKKALIFYLAGSIYLLIVSVYYWCLGKFIA